MRKILVLLVSLALLGPVPSFAATRPVPSAATWTAPLSTVGRYIVDATGQRFKLKSGNWHGGSGTWDGSGSPADPAHNHAGEVANQLPLGLDRAPIAGIIGSFHELGLNSIRLQFSNEMIHDTRPVPDAAVAANPALRGRTPLQVYDAVVRALTDDGFAVILNNHTATSRWCCAVDGNERWNTGQSDAQWEDDWLFMARRYATDKRVVGADLYNEVRRNTWDDPNWGAGGSRDWAAAAQRAGDRILAEANPDLLIVVEGINWTGIPLDGLPHGRPTLRAGPAALPHAGAVAQARLLRPLLRLHRPAPQRSDRRWVRRTTRAIRTCPVTSCSTCCASRRSSSRNRTTTSPRRSGSASSASVAAVRPTRRPGTGSPTWSTTWSRRTRTSPTGRSSAGTTTARATAGH